MRNRRYDPVMYYTPCIAELLYTKYSKMCGARSEPPDWRKRMDPVTTLTSRDLEVSLPFDRTAARAMASLREKARQ